MAQFQARPTRLAQQLRNNATSVERLLWTRLSRRQLGGFKFSRQMPIGPFVCDFLCRERCLIVELDGGQHSCRAEEDELRTQFLERLGYRVIRFWNNEVIENLPGVLESIEQALIAGPPPAPPARGRGVDLPPPLKGRGG